MVIYSDGTHLHLARPASGLIWHIYIYPYMDVPTIDALIWIVPPYLLPILAGPSWDREGLILKGKPDSFIGVDKEAILSSVQAVSDQVVVYCC